NGSFTNLNIRANQCPGTDGHIGRNASIGMNYSARIYNNSSSFKSAAALDPAVSTHNDGGSSQRTINRSLAIKFPDATFFRQHTGFQLQSVSRNNLPLETHIINAGEEIDGTIFRPFVHGLETQNSRRLRQGFDNHHALKDRRLRKVAIKYVFIAGDIFVGNDLLA